MRPVPSEPSFNKVGTLLAAVCWLLEAPECLGKSRSSEAHVSGQKVDRRVLATDIDADLGFITCVLDWIGQTVRSRAELHTGLI